MFDCFVSHVQLVWKQEHGMKVSMLTCSGWICKFQVENDFQCNFQVENDFHCKFQIEMLYSVNSKLKMIFSVNSKLKMIFSVNSKLKMIFSVNFKLKMVFSVNYKLKIIFSVYSKLKKGHNSQKYFHSYLPLLYMLLPIPFLVGPSQTTDFRVFQTGRV